MKISEMDDDTAAATLLRIYRAACDCYDAEEHGAHPSQAINQMARNARDSKARDEGGLGPVELERTDHGADNPPPTPGTPQPPVAGNDSAAEEIEDAKIRNSGSATMASDLALAHARRSSPARIKAMENAIPALRRLR